MDLQTVFTALILLVLAVLASMRTRSLQKTVGTRFYLYAWGFFNCIALWAIAFFMLGVIQGPGDFDLLLGSQYVLRPFGYLSLGFMIAAMESVKSEKRTTLTNIGFLLAGGLIVGVFSPTAFALKWTVQGWTVSYSFEFEVERAIIFLTVVVSAAPLAASLFRRLGPHFRRDRPFMILFWITVLFSPAVLLIQPLAPISPLFLQPLFHSSILLATIALFVLLVLVLFIRHPTILFVGGHEINEIYIIKKDSGIPLFHFTFQANRREGGTEILSAFFTGIKHYVMESIGGGEIESIVVGEEELLIEEGLFTYGVLIAKKSSELTRNLLTIAVSSFESNMEPSKAEYTMPHESENFKATIERYFEFALLRPTG